ncbi:hypothetical protein QQ045_001763 [Rhodiola kirilowii]
MHCSGVLHFVDRNATFISYGLQTNSTAVMKRGHFEDPTFKFQIPLQVAAEREIARTLIGEKELKLRQAMTMMGLYDSAYWVPWLTWEGIVTLLSSLFTVLFGMMFQFDFFLNNSFAVVFLVFFLFQLNMIGFAFMLSAFISKSSSSTTVGFSIFIVGFLTQLVTAFGFPCSDTFSNAYRFVWPLFPPNLLPKLFRYLLMQRPHQWMLGLVGREGQSAPNDDECIITINDIYLWLVATFAVWFLLAIYFDNIIPNSSGVRKSVFYFVRPGYWTGKGGNKVEGIIYGDSIRSPFGMSNIRRIIGVCPQFDILWSALSGQEHLHLFASIKGLAPASIKSVAKKSLDEVKLTQAARMRAGSSSDPKLVILDEPTTGMDPITRRHVWDIIENAKKGRAIVLTTHSMEEADILSDRIGIMAKGRLRCIGTSIRLKSKFGTGFIANVSFSGGLSTQTPLRGEAVVSPQHDSVKEFFKQRLDVVPKEENKAFLTFVIPHDKEELLTDFFSELQDREEEFGISDIQLGLTTFEEVFLNIARQAELESAAAEGTLVTLILTSGTSVQIPVGARFVGIPGTEDAEHPRGFMVEVYWDQDDSGTLCIAGHSPEMPIPPNVDFAASTNAAVQRGLGNCGRRIQGIVVDPNQLPENISH